MGFERNIGRAAIAVAALFGSAGVSAATREPLVVTELSSPALVPLSGAGRSGDASVDEATERFRLAIAEALQSDQRAMQEACRSGPPAAASSKARFDWQARCFYRRH